MLKHSYSEYKTLCEGELKMNKNNKQNTSTRKSAFYCSIILFVLGIPMMYIASFSKGNAIFIIISVVYVLLLLINGIIHFPIVIDMLKKKTTKK